MTVIDIIVGLAGIVGLLILLKHIGPTVMEYIVDERERDMSDGSLTCHGPMTAQRLIQAQPFFWFSILGILVLIFFASLVASYPQTFGGLARHAKMLAWSLVIPLAFAVLVFFRFLAHKHALICPNCKHKIPLSTPWVCRIRHCGQHNPILYRKRLEDMGLPRLSWLAGRCASCEQYPAGFICTVCRKPIYFTEEPERQKPRLCAYAVGDKAVEEIEEKQEIPEEKGAYTMGLQELEREAKDAVEAKKNLDSILMQAEQDMTEEDYRRFKETAMDKFRKLMKKMTGPRY